MGHTGNMAVTENLRRAWRRRLRHWIERRGPTNPPLSLGYRQIFILPTRFGTMLGMLMTAMLVGSLNFNNNLGLLTTFIVAGLGVNSTLLAYRNLHGLRILQTHAKPVFAGDRARFQVTAANDGFRPRSSLSIVHEDGRQPFALEPVSTRLVTVEIKTRRRGWHHPGRFGIDTTHPMGLFRAWSWFWPERAILVWPRPAAHPPPLPEGRSHESGGRLRNEPEGEEFHSLRRWREGDPLHRIAWKASQRHQTLLSREFRHEQSRHLNLDMATVPGRDREERISVLTAWVLEAEAQNRSWSLILDGHRLGPDQGRAHRNACLQALAEL